MVRIPIPEDLTKVREQYRAASQRLRKGREDYLNKCHEQVAKLKGREFRDAIATISERCKKAGLYSQSMSEPARRHAILRYFSRLDQHGKFDPEFWGIWLKKKAVNYDKFISWQEA